MRNIDKIAFFVVLFSMAVTFSFGIQSLEKASLTDEHYWTFDRTPKFWKKLVVEKKFSGTRRSDKPGVTLMVLSGPSLLTMGFPKERIETSTQEFLEINFAYRLPVLLFMVFSLPVFYFLVKRLLNKRSALLTSLFVGSSPVLIGISRIVNPDSLLWVFSAWSILSFFIFLKEKKESRKWILWSGFFMGLALLTKYVATFIFVFFLGIIFLELIFKEDTKDKLAMKKELKRLTTGFLGFIFISLATFTALYPATWSKPSRILKGTFFSEAFEPIWPFFAVILGLLFIDVILFRTGVVSFILGHISKQRKLLGRASFSFFVVIIFTALINAHLGQKWFNFERVLASPKSSHQTESILSIFVSNFYPLLFAISPVILFFITWFLIRVIMGKVDFSENRAKIVLYLIVFILLYYTGSVFSQVASVIRYQIILYPVILIVGAICAEDFFRVIAGFMKNESINKKVAFSILLIIPLLMPLVFSRPFYMAYASFLLPGEYYLDLKDMGYGSLEAAERLNSIPNAEKISIWTDKRGVCDFFVGNCLYDYNFKEMKDIDIDYYVISSGGASRANRLGEVRTRGDSVHEKEFRNLYATEELFWKLEMAERENNFVKIIKTDAIVIK